MRWIEKWLQIFFQFLNELWSICFSSGISKGKLAFVFIGEFTQRLKNGSVTFDLLVESTVSKNCGKKAFEASEVSRLGCQRSKG